MKRKNVIAVLLCITILINNFIHVFTYSGIAYGVGVTEITPTTGYVTVDGGSRVNVRTDAGTVWPIVKSPTGADVKLYNGHEVTVTGEKTASDGVTWYRVSFKYADGSTLEGYIHSDYVKIDNIDYSPDKDFEKYLDKQKFPESYKPYLRDLHAKYSNWVFVADHLDYDWEEALSNQNKLGRSLISINAISSWKSTQTGAFDWKNNKWVSFDGTSWAAASKELIAYCMDPRNFLDENYIFQFELLSFESKYQSIDGVNKIIGGTFMENATIKDSGTEEEKSYAQVIMEAAERSGVSPFHLAASIIQEQGSKGNSGSISGNVGGYQGLYNYYNWGAYAANGNSATVNGLIYASATDEATLRPWNTKYASIVGGAIKLGSSYINIGQDTLYYKKFDYVGTPYTHQYMTHILAPGSEALLTSRAYTADMKNGTAIIFKLPVYQNMPENPAPCPAGNGNPNNYLGSISVAGQQMTPTFSYDVTDYNIVVGSGIKTINISCQTIDKNATVQGAGEVSLKTGTNNLTVSVKAENGSIRKYNLIVIKDEEPGEIKDDIGLSSDAYVIDNEKLYITGILPGTPADDFLKGIACNAQGSLSILNSNLENHDGNIGTGSVLMFKNDENGIKKYETVVFGDVNGDGAVNLIDAIMLQKHILNISPLKGTYLYAGDVNRKDGITLIDAIMLQKHILNIQQISQR